MNNDNITNTDSSNHIYFGTYTITDETILLDTLQTAYKYGYRRIDTATLYKNPTYYRSIFKYS